jgi:hypothetical protein
MTCRACEHLRNENGANAGPRAWWKTADCVCLKMQTIEDLDAARLCIDYRGNVAKGQVACHE